MCLETDVNTNTVLQLLTSPMLAGIVNIVSLLAFALALKALRDGKTQTELSLELTTKTETIFHLAERVEKALSTRYISAWPDYISDITKLVDSARDSIGIITAAPGYGCFSAPDAWEELSHAIVSKQNAGVTITLVTATEEERLRNHRLQFMPALQDWSKWLKASFSSRHATNAFRLGRMCLRHGIAMSPEADGEWFIETMVRVQKAILADTYYNSRISLVADQLALIVWVADGKRAIFAISNPTALPPAFYTEDKNIVDALSALVQRYAS